MYAGECVGRVADHTAQKKGQKWVYETRSCIDYNYICVYIGDNANSSGESIMNTEGAEYNVKITLYLQCICS